MKTKLYRIFVNAAYRQAHRYEILAKKYGKYQVALRLWTYKKRFPNADNWASRFVDEFKRKYSRR